MARVKIGHAEPDRMILDAEIARLRDLDIGALRKHWHTLFKRRAPAHLPRHLLFRVLAYRLQADQLGDLDSESRRLLDSPESPEKAGQRAVELGRRTVELRPGTVLGREWNRRMHRVVVLTDGFAWNGKTYPSLSNVWSVTCWRGWSTAGPSHYRALGRVPWFANFRKFWAALRA
jgi:hypothetical protein